MTEGMVVGGWEYIIPAYVITAAALALYVWSIHQRRRRLERKSKHDE